MSEQNKVDAEVASEQVVSAEETMENVRVLKRGDIVTGKIIKIEEQSVLVDVGHKFDGFISARDLSAVAVANVAELVALGQEIHAKVISIDEKDEKLVLSKRAYEQETAWSRLQQQLEAGTILEAKVAEIVKGGLVVDVGVRGFVPASMVERHYVEDFSSYKGKTLRLKIREIDQEKNKLILSQKDVLDQEFEANKKKRLGEFEAGQELDGKVQRLTDFGAFIDLGGIDGLVHVSEISWNHVKKPGDVLQEGQSVRVKVLKVDAAADKVSLSIKAATPGPWQLAQNQYAAGQVVSGVVKRIVSFGCFVELAPGVEGLVHISQLAHKHVATPNEVVKEGQSVQAKVLEVNIAEKRISLSMKELEEAPQRPERERQPKAETESTPLLPKQDMNFTLGEKFGDKLSKFNK